MFEVGDTHRNLILTEFHRQRIKCFLEMRSDSAEEFEEKKWRKKYSRFDLCNFVFSLFFSQNLSAEPQRISQNHFILCRWHSSKIRSRPNFLLKKGFVRLLPIPSIDKNKPMTVILYLKGILRSTTSEAKAFGIMTLSMKYIYAQYKDIQYINNQHKGIQHSNTQHINKNVTLGITTHCI